MQYVPPDFILPEYEDDDEDNPDMRLCQYAKEHMIIKEEHLPETGASEGVCCRVYLHCMGCHQSSAARMCMDARMCYGCAGAVGGA
jgi:hypothetical protein